ncbi:alpha/beta fold hydrolase [bacterium]|nr:alpha/beta fold hydrolase [bacterium]
MMKIFPENWTHFIVFLISLYVAVLLFVFIFQKSLLYMPGKDARTHARYQGWECWPNESVFHGYVSTRPPKSLIGTVFVWHGNAGTALDRGYYMYALEKRGLRVILMEYPGYGDRDGTLGEISFLIDAEKALTIAFEDFKPPYYILGESLGNGVASAMAKRFSDKVKGLIMVTPWATLPDLAQSLYPFLPAKWLTRDKFDNISNTEDYPGPVAVIMAGNDNIIPNSHTLRLYKSMPEPKKLWTFKASGHNNMPLDPGEKWWDEVLEFLSKNQSDQEKEDKPEIY